MSLCSVGLIGASYVRDEPLPEIIEVTSGQQTTLSVPYIYDEYTAGEIPLAVNLRQATNSELLSFVSFSEEV